MKNFGKASSQTGAALFENYRFGQKVLLGEYRFGQKRLYSDHTIYIDYFICTAFDFSVRLDGVEFFYECEKHFRRSAEIHTRSAVYRPNVGQL